MYNQSAIQSSNLWTAKSTGGDANFCIKLSQYSNGDATSRILFNFIETTYKVEVDLTTGFSTKVEVVRTEAGDGGINVVNIDENITAYQCNDSFDEIVSPSPLTQGDSLQICVETGTDSVLEVGKIREVTVSQNGTKSFNYVSSYTDSSWAVSSCKDVNTTSSKCMVKLQLLGAYFSDKSPARLTVEGVVKLDYLGRRMLHNAEKNEVTVTERSLFGGEAEKNAVFNLYAALEGEAEDVVGDVPDATTDKNQAESDAVSLYGLWNGGVVLALTVIVVTSAAMNMN